MNCLPPWRSAEDWQQSGSTRPSICNESRISRSAHERVDPRLRPILDRAVARLRCLSGHSRVRRRNSHVASSSSSVHRTLRGSQGIELPEEDKMIRQRVRERRHLPTASCCSVQNLVALPSRADFRSRIQPCEPFTRICPFQSTASRYPPLLAEIGCQPPGIFARREMVTSCDDASRSAAPTQGTNEKGRPTCASL